jgi:fructose-bisphosphate aldolase, class II
MGLVSMVNMLEKAEIGKYAIGAFNLNLDLQVQAIFQAAHDLKSPLIIQASNGANIFQSWKGDEPEDVFRGARRIKDLAEVYAKDYPDLNYALHLDHGSSFEIVKACIDAGFSSVMIDGSHLSLDENIELTRKVIDYAHEKGVSVEGELGTLGGKSHSETTDSIIYTRSEDVVRFVNETGVDALAICWGTRHGHNKAVDGILDLRPEIIKDSYEALKKEKLKCYLVSHGSSTVPFKYVQQINQHLGYVVSSGVPLEYVKLAINNGIRKINIDTDLRLAMTGAIRQVLDENRGVIDQRDYLKEARQAMYETVKDSMHMFDSVEKI